jgi:hypothetical protein
MGIAISFTGLRVSYRADQRRDHEKKKNQNNEGSHKNGSLENHFEA